jgi:uncharacterized protein YlxW (UPF0749 family)
MELNNVNATVADATQNEKQGQDKFRDIEALKASYNSLQAEFTKRCQRIKELEGEVKNASLKREITRDEKLDIIKEYLEDISKNNSAVILTGGQVAKTPIKRPKTISEAGRLAKEFFIKSKEIK